MKKLFLPSKQELEFFLKRDLSALEIADKYGISSSKVRRLCKTHSLQLKPSLWRETLIITKDGHRVRSIYEAIISNWLFENGFDYEYEPRLLKTRFKSDFLINGVYVEIWGVKRCKKYKERQDVKRRLYKDKQLLLIELMPNDFQGNHESGWVKKLTEKLWLQI